MKNIYKFLVLMLILNVSACKDSDESAEESSGLFVVETKASFSPKGGNDGYIKVNLTEGYTATSDQDWCTLSLDKETIKVSATVNLNLGSRAALVTIISGDKKEEVAVFQYGLIFSVEKTELFFDLSDTGPEKNQKIKVSSNLTSISVTAADDWVTATMTGDSLVVYCNSVATTKRSTTITVSIEDIASAVVTVKQEPPSYESYLGDWTLTGTDYATNTQVSYPNIKITQKVKDVSYYVEGWAINVNLISQKFEMLYDSGTGRITIKGAQKTGTYLTSYEVYLGGMVYYNSRITFITGTYTALSGYLNLSQGTVIFDYSTVNLGAAGIFKFIGAVYRLTADGGSSFAPFTNDPYVLNNAVLTKK